MLFAIESIETYMNEFIFIHEHLRRNIFFYESLNEQLIIYIDV